MREIKFRAINNMPGCERRFIYFGVLESISNSYLEINTIGQFTGLFDKSGTEIYEGDIVSFENSFSNNKPFIGELIYYAGCKPIIRSCRHRDVDIAETNDSDLKVIGNVYFNSELLGR